MKKFLLSLFMLFNIALIAAASFVLYMTIAHRAMISPRLNFPRMPSPPASPAHFVAPAMLPSSSSGTVSPAAITAPVSSTPGTQTKIFTYRNSHAKQVAIRADFTGWKAEPMQRDSAGVWTYRAVLSPGEYAYCYSVDDKPPLKDPINKRTKVIGRATVSAIVVK